jgi:hypothetical protein
LVVLLLACTGPEDTGETGRDTGAEVVWDDCGEWDRSETLNATFNWAWDEDQDWAVTWTTSVVDRQVTDAGQRFIVVTEGDSSAPGTQEYTWRFESHVGCEDGWVTRWWSHSATHIVSSSGEVTEDIYTTEYDNGYRLLPTSLSVGDTFTTGGDRRFIVDGEVLFEDALEKDWEVLEASSVVVPAGVFDSLRATDGDGVVHIVRDLGFVRWEGFSWLLSTEGL